MTSKNFKSDILNELKHQIETDKDIIIDAVVKGDEKAKQLFVNEYLMHQKMYDLLYDIEWEMFQVDTAEE